jgi:hypothetical protein
LVMATTLPEGTEPVAMMTTGLVGVFSVVFW